MSIPHSEPSRQHALALIERKDAIQAQIDHHLSALSLNESTMNSPLLDPQGFPRADIDIVAVRNARVRVIELRNDLNAIMEEISQALQGIYRPEEAGITNPNQTSSTTTSSAKVNGVVSDTPFALVNGVAPQSPAAQAGLQRGDLVLRFGDLSASSFAPPITLQPLSTFVSAHENQPIELRIKRPSSSAGTGTAIVSLSLTPRSGWGGRGLLGCHLVPHSE